MLLKKYGIFFAFLFAVTLGCNRSSKSNQLKVGTQSGYPPFEYVNEKGEIVGFDIDLAQIIAKQLGKELVLKDMDYDGEILSLRQGKIDLILSGMDITQSRLKEIQMVPYHGGTQDSLSLLFWGEIPAGVQTLEDIARLKLGAVSVEAGATPEEYLSRRPSLSVKSFEGALAPLMDVKLGKSLANLVETDVAKYLKKQHPEIAILNVSLADHEQTLGFGIGVKKGNEELFQQVSQMIEELKQSGELQRLEAKWFEGDGV